MVHWLIYCILFDQRINNVVDIYEELITESLLSPNHIRKFLENRINLKRIVANSIILFW
jgi:hypothetical protein